MLRHESENHKFHFEGKSKKSTNRIRRLGICAAILLILIIISGGLVVWAKGTIEKPNSNNAATVDFVVNQGEGGGDIAKKLKDEGLIRNYFAFILYLNYTQSGDKLQVGSYKIAKNLTIKEVASIITNGKIVTNKITIPEGWTNDQIANYLVKNTTITANDFMAAAKYDPAKHKYDFLYPLKKGDTLEGYLYPDTYQISLKPTAEEVVKKMLENFDKKLVSADREQIKKSGGLNPYEIVILASIVEREVSNPDDRKKVAGVFLNRLNNNMPLESCATIQYILKSDKWVFTYEETRIPSPYNTYLNPGLPIGPIGNPSIQSIEAVLFPEKTNYFYFLSANGKTYFSTNLDEHNAKKIQYLR